MNLQLSDLLISCEKCNGKGEIPFIPSKTKEQFGSHLTWKSPEVCSNCRGKGVILTQTGKVFIEFIKLTKGKFFNY